MVSERNRVIEYLGHRLNKAWNKGEGEEACSCAHFLDALEKMTDAEYDCIYVDEDGEII